MARYSTGNVLGTSIQGSEIDNSTIGSGKLSFGVWEKVVDEEITGSAVTSIDVTGLDLDTALAYMIIFRGTNATSTGQLSLFYNGDTTATNYDKQYSGGNNTTFAGSRSNSAQLCAQIGGNETTFVGIVARGVGKACLTGNYTEYETTLIRTYNMSHIWRTENNVTQMTFTNATANAIGIGSRLMIFKVSA